MSYALPADLLARYDARTVGNLVSDNNVAVDPAGLLVNANLQAALDSASGQIEAAVLQGGMYQVTDLNALTGNSQAYLVQICCEIAFARLYDRRPYVDAGNRRAEALKAAEEKLNQLRTGVNIFNVPANLAAGQASITTPTVAQYQQNRTIAARCRGNAYPHVVLPWPQG